MATLFQTRRLIIPFISLVTLLPAARAIGQSPQASLAARIGAVLDDPVLASGVQGVCIEPIEDGRTLYDRNAHRVLLPASNNKLLTSSAALAILGPDFVYRTGVYSTASRGASGVIEGDLVLVGSGDPLLTRDDLASLADSLRAAGIRRITGKLRYDDSRFDQQWLGDGWTWDDEPFYYSAQVSALNVDENVIEVVVSPGSGPGSPALVTTEPKTSYVTIRSQAVTGKQDSRSSLSFDRLRGQNVITVGGTVRFGSGVQERAAITIDNPARYCAALFLDALRADGISVSGEPEAAAQTSQGATMLAEHVSPPLSVILSRLLKPSDNLVAESLLKTIGAAKTGKGTAGYGGSGASAARAWLVSAGLDTREFHQSDGSGMSRMDYVSPASLVRLLKFMYGQRNFSLWYDALPIAGLDGTLRNRMKGTHAAGNCHAKTGSLSHVSALSGYVTDHDGKPLAFSIIMNNHLAAASLCTRAEDKIVEILADYTEKPQAAAATSTGGQAQ